MKIEFLPSDLHRTARLVAENGEILAEFEVDPEFEAIKLYQNEEGSTRAEIVLDLPVGSPAVIVDADERSVRALPDAPQDPFDFLKDCYDFDPYDYEDYPRDDEEDFMDGLCPGCAQELCLHCGQCKTPACEAENCDCL